MTKTFNTASLGKLSCVWIKARAKAQRLGSSLVQLTPRKRWIETFHDWTTPFKISFGPSTNLPASHFLKYFPGGGSRGRAEWNERRRKHQTPTAIPEGSFSILGTLTKSSPWNHNHRGSESLCRRFQVAFPASYQLTNGFFSAWRSESHCTLHPPLTNQKWLGWSATPDFSAWIPLAPFPFNTSPTLTTLAPSMEK